MSDYTTVTAVLGKVYLHNLPYREDAAAFVCSGLPLVIVVSTQPTPIPDHTTM